MARDLMSLDVTGSREIRALAEDVARTGVARVLRRDGEDLAIISPAAGLEGVEPSRTGEASPNAWLDGLIGIAASDGPGDVSANIHRYVAEASHAEIEGRPGR